MMHILIEYANCHHYSELIFNMLNKCNFNKRSLFPSLLLTFLELKWSLFIYRLLESKDSCDGVQLE